MNHGADKAEFVGSEHVWSNVTEEGTLILCEMRCNAMVYRSLKTVDGSDFIRPRYYSPEDIRKALAAREPLRSPYQSPGMRSLSVSRCWYSQRAFRFRRQTNPASNCRRSSEMAGRQTNDAKQLRLAAACAHKSLPKSPPELPFLRAQRWRDKRADDFAHILKQ